MLNRRKDKYRKLKKEALKSEVLNTSAVKIKKKSVWPKRIVAFIVSLILVTATVMFGVIYAFDLLGSGLNASDTISPDALDSPTTLEGTNKTERLNFLLLGTDGSNSRTDTIIFASFDLVNEKINLISIPRDTRILINGKYHKINSCAVYGGEELLFDTLRDITGAPIHYYAKVSFSGFRNIIDILGGVDFNVPVDMYYSDPYQNLYINLKKGEQHLDGEKAEQLVRFRRYAEADIQRTRVQKDFIKALIQQKLTPEYILKAPTLYADIAKYVTTNFTASDLMNNMEIIKFFQNIDEDSITTYEMPGLAKTINGASYWIHDVDKTLELFEEYFGGSGESEAYSKYAAAESKAHSYTPPAAENREEETSSEDTSNKQNSTSNESSNINESSENGTSTDNTSSSVPDADMDDDPAQQNGNSQKEDASSSSSPDIGSEDSDASSVNEGNNTSENDITTSSDTSKTDDTTEPTADSSTDSDISTPPAWLT